MNSYLLQDIPERLEPLTVEGWHKPGSLTQASGAWIHAAGAFVLESGNYPLNAHDQWVWLVVERGSIVLSWDQHDLALSTGSTCFLPGGFKPCAIAAGDLSSAPPCDTSAVPQPRQTRREDRLARMASRERAAE